MSFFGNGRPAAGSEDSTDPAIGRIWSRRSAEQNQRYDQSVGSGAGGREQRASTLHMRAVYVATAEGRLADYLTKHPELVTVAVTAALERDLGLATEYGDLDAAQLAAEAAAAVHDLLGNRPAALARYLDLIRLQASRAESMDDLRDLRDSALVIGALALAAARPSSLVECWVVAIDAGLRLADLAGGGRLTEESASYLLEAMRAVADLGDLLVDIPVEHRNPAQLRRFVELLGEVSERASWGEWPTHEVIVVRALTRRFARI